MPLIRDDVKEFCLVRWKGGRVELTKFKVFKKNS